MYIERERRIERQREAWEKKERKNKERLTE